MPDVTPGQCIAEIIRAQPEMPETAIAALIDTAITEALACVSDRGAIVAVRAAQIRCGAEEHGVVCGERTYAGHLYCPKHQLRFARTGDPAGRRKRGRKRRV